MPRKKTILVFCAHSDDQIIGPGATLAKYAREGKKVCTVIFSYGEASLPLLRREIAIKRRVAEAKQADKIIGGSGVVFLGLRDGKCEEDVKKKRVAEKIARIIAFEKPIKIFTHSEDDPHPDHRAVCATVLNARKIANHKCDVYSFSIWNPLRFRKRNLPKMYVDVTSTFRTKLKALKVFKSQRIAIFTLIWAVYVNAIAHGLHIYKRFAERFVKIR